MAFLQHPFHVLVPSGKIPAHLFPLVSRLATSNGFVIPWPSMGGESHAGETEFGGPAVDIVLLRSWRICFPWFLSLCNGESLYISLALRIHEDVLALRTWKGKIERMTFVFSPVALFPGGINRQNPALSRLAAKCSMPAGMWCHGIHTFSV